MNEQEKRDKVIKGLEACSLADTKDDCIGYGCPYFIYSDKVSGDCLKQMFDDALALLKAQEPIAVQKKPVEMCGLQTWDWTCGNCGNIVLYKANYCSCCGKAVKWE